MQGKSSPSTPVNGSPLSPGSRSNNSTPEDQVGIRISNLMKGEEGAAKLALLASMRKPKKQELDSSMSHGSSDHLNKFVERKETGSSSEYEDDVDDDDEDDSDHVSENQSSSYDKRVISPKQTERMVQEKVNVGDVGNALLERRDSLESTGDTTEQTGLKSRHREDMRDYFKNGVVVLNATHSYSVADTESSEVTGMGRRGFLQSDITVSDDDDDDSAVTTTTEGSMTRMNTMPDVSLNGHFTNQQALVELMKLKDSIAELDLAIAMLKNKLPDELQIVILRIEKESKEKIYAAIKCALRRENSGNLARENSGGSGSGDL